MIAQPLLDQVLSLSLGDRYELIYAIEKSVGAKGELTAMMVQEAEDRVAAVDIGELGTVDGPSALGSLRAKFSS